MIKKIDDYHFFMFLLLFMPVFLVFVMAYPVYKRFEHNNISIVDYSESFFNEQPILNLSKFDINADFNKETQTLIIKNIPSEAISNIHINEKLFYYHGQCINDFCNLIVELRRD